MLEKDGKLNARVTEVLQPFVDYSHISRNVLTHKCNIGTQVHEAIHSDILGDFPVINEDTVRYFRSYLGWKETLKPEFVQSEQRYYDESLMLTGCIDTLVKLPGKTVPILVDFKTSAAESPSWELQAHLYAHLLGVNGVSVMPIYHFVRLNWRGGLPGVCTYKFNPNTRAKCLQAVADFWASHKK